MKKRNVVYENGVRKLFNEWVIKSRETDDYVIRESPVVDKDLYLVWLCEQNRDKMYLSYVLEKDTDIEKLHVAIKYFYDFISNKGRTSCCIIYASAFPEILTQFKKTMVGLLNRDYNAYMEPDMDFKFALLSSNKITVID